MTESTNVPLLPCPECAITVGRARTNCEKCFVLNEAQPTDQFTESPTPEKTRRKFSAAIIVMVFVGALLISAVTVRILIRMQDRPAAPAADTCRDTMIAYKNYANLLLQSASIGNKAAAALFDRDYTLSSFYLDQENDLLRQATPIQARALVLETGCPGS